MPETENQQVTDYRGQVIDRMRSRYPDRTFDSPDGTNGTDGLAQSVLETLNDYDSRIGEYEEQNNRLVELFRTDSKAAAFFNTWVATKNPAAAFRNIYGADAWNAMNSEEGAKVLAEIEAAEAKAKADNEAYEAEKEANLNASFEALDAWGNEKGLTDEQKTAVFMRFYDILSDALIGKYSTDLFEMAWKSDHYADDVESARHEGEVAGRNARIQEMARSRQAQAAMPPTMTGQGTPASPSRPDRPQQWSDFLRKK